MSLAEYDELDATAMAAAVKAGELHPAELLEAAIARIEARNPKLNAVVHKMYDRARSRLGALPEGPLRGVPFLVKDLKLQMAGTPTSDGTRLQLGRNRPQTSELARRYEAAGLQIVGKTNTPEFGLMGITEPAVYGPCRNPWHADHTPGGSSGGAAAAVAARMVPAAHGGDGGGSIRIPASCCGLFGLKPTRGRVTMAPFMGEGWGGFVQEHVVTRSVRDSALLLDVVDGPTPGEPYAAPHKERPWVDEVRLSSKRLKVAFTTDALFAGESHPDCVRAVQHSVDLLGELGHETHEACPDFERRPLVRAYFLTVATGIAHFVSKTAAAAGTKPRPADFEPSTWLMALIGWATPAPELLAAQITMQQAARKVAAFFETYDVFVTATVAQPPVRIGELSPSTVEQGQMWLLRRLPFKKMLDVALEKMGEGRLAYTPNTQLFNQTGQPAMSVPLFTNDEGLPIGTQVVGRFGDEATLFQLATQFEHAQPWSMPPVSAG